MISETLNRAIDGIVNTGVTHIGFVPSNDSGEYLIAEPNDHPYGVSATFAKTKIGQGERPSLALIRCLEEQIGLEAASVYPIRKVWVTQNSVSFYFAGLVNGNKDQVRSKSASLGWLNADEANEKIGQSENLTTRQRDLAILSNARTMCLSPCRNILLMIRELHTMGFERLRARTYIYSLGTWRCEIIPAAWVSSDPRNINDAILFDSNSYFQSIFHCDSIHFYTSANDQEVMPPDSVFMSPRELALEFIKRRPEQVAVGFGPDPEYVAWYASLE